MKRALVIIAQMTLPASADNVHLSGAGQITGVIEGGAETGTVR